MSIAGAKTNADKKIRRAKILVHAAGFAAMHIANTPAKKIGIEAHIPEPTHVQI